MVPKLKLVSIINKYYLGINESVKWVFKEGNLTIDFMTPSQDMIGKIFCKNLISEGDLLNSNLAVYDTKKLLNLLSICEETILLEVEKQNKLCSKLYISDTNFNVTYALADPFLIKKPGEVNYPIWDIEITLNIKDIENLIKAKNSLIDTIDLIISTNLDLDGNPQCQFSFGNQVGHSNKVNYFIRDNNIQKLNVNLPFNSENFKNVLQANKDMEKGYLFLSEQGLICLKFEKDDIFSEYYIVRQSEEVF